jgi:hypothetical protein
LTFAVPTASPVQDILEKDEFTLSELLEEDELLQEVKAQNKKLIDLYVHAPALATVSPPSPLRTSPARFRPRESRGSPCSPPLAAPPCCRSLALESSVAEMLDFITTAAPEGASDMRVHKYPYVSCEIVCCDVPEVLDTLVEGRDGALLASLFRILGWEGSEGAGDAAGGAGREAGPLDPRLAGYFEKVFALLHQRKGLELVTFLNGGGIALFARFAACLESYSVMETVRRMLQPALLDSYDDQGGSFGDDGGFGFGGGGGGSGDEGSGADSFPTVCWQGDARVVGMLLEVLGAQAEQGEDEDGTMTSAREHVAELLLLIVYNNSVTDGGGGMGGMGESFGDAGADGGGGPKRTSPLLAAIASRGAAERIVRLALPDGKEGGAEMYSASSAMSSALAVLETLVSCCPMAVGSAAAGGAEGEEEKADEKGEGAAAAAAAAGDDAKDDGVVTATVLDGDGGGGGAEDAGPAPNAPVFDVIAERVGLIAQWLKGDVGAPRTMRYQDARETTTPCLGIGRLRVVELVVVLVQCRHAGVEAALVEHGVLPLCLDLFFAFPWSNMLHSLVEHVAIAVVEGGSEPLQLCLLRDGNLIARVVEAYAADEEQRKGAKRGRLGYMGHINRISNLVLASIEASERDIESSANNSGLDESGAGSAFDDSSMGFTGASVAAARFARLVQESEDKEQWNNFVESTLKEINCLENVPLGADGGGADDSVELPSGGAGGDDDGGSGSVFNLDALGRQLDSVGSGEGDGDDFAPRTFASNLSDVSGTAGPRLPAACLPAGLPALSARPAAPRIVADAALLPAFLSARAGRLGPFVGI